MWKIFEPKNSSWNVNFGNWFNILKRILIHTFNFSFFQRNSRLKPQFLITSATVSDEMKSFVQQYIPDILIMETSNVSPPSLDHKWIISPLHRRTETLLQLLRQNSHKPNNCKKCIIFVQKLEIGDDLFEVKSYSC